MKNEIAEMGKLASSLLDGKDFFVSELAERLTAAAIRHPQDRAIVSLGEVVNRMAEKRGSLATMNQREFQELYDQIGHYGNREKFASLFGDLLQEEMYQGGAHTNEQYIATLRGDGTSIDIVDREMVAELEGLFSKTSLADKATHSKFAENGRKCVSLELDTLGFPGNSVTIASKNDDFIIYSADVTVGNTSANVLIPAEVIGNSVMMPSVFVDGQEFVDLNESNLHRCVAKQRKNDYVTATPVGVLQSLVAAKKQYDLQKVAEESNVSWDSIRPESQGVYGDIVDHVYEDLSPMKVEMPEALKDFSESILTEALLESGTKYPRDLVVKAKNVIETELRACGVSCDKVKVMAESESGLVFVTNVIGKAGKKTIHVPIEIAGNRVCLPSHFSTGPDIKEFNSANIKSFAHDTSPGYLELFSSEKQSMSFKELYSHMIVSASVNNMPEAQEALAVIEDKFGAEYHKMAFNELLNVLNIAYGTDSEKKSVDEVGDYIKASLERARTHESNASVMQNVQMIYTK